MTHTTASTLPRRLPLPAVIATLCAAMSMPVFAQEGSGDQASATRPTSSAELLDQVVVTGTRVQGHSPLESMSPIDVVNPVDLERQASADFTDQLSNLLPSFNTQRFPIADGSAFVRPANLRNLPPDETLVLVNGKRRHRSALVNLQTEPFGTVNQGAQAVDFGLFPAAAIQRVEVLRDGSSAQYGSDAIAGVINIILNNNPEGIAVDSQYGSTYDGDGDKFQSSVNLGLPLGPDGFFNATVEYFDSNHTSRGSARPDAVAVGEAVGVENVPFKGLGQRWGDPDTHGIRTFYNAELPVNDAVTVYSFGSYADEEFSSSFFYRTPVGVPGVTPRGTLFVDANEDGLPDPVDQSIIDNILAAGGNPNEFVTADPNSPSGFVALNPIFAKFPAATPPLSVPISRITRACSVPAVSSIRGCAGTSVAATARTRSFTDWPIRSIRASASTARSTSHRAT